MQRLLRRCVGGRSLPGSRRALSTKPSDEYIVPAAAIESFRTKGYALLPKFLSEAELRPIELLYDQFMRGEIMTQKVHGKDFCDMSQPFDTCVVAPEIQSRESPDALIPPFRPFSQWQLVNAMLPTRYSPFMKKAAAIYAARAASVARQLFPNTPMAFDYDQLLNKRPQKQGAVFPWHQDMAYWPPTPVTSTVTLSLAIDETTVENGALRFVTGSGVAQKLLPFKPAGKSRDDTHALVIDIDETKLAADTVTLCAQRGDVTIHDEWVVHGSGGNLSNGERRTFVHALRAAETVELERKAGFSHSHEDSVNWDTFR